jgi:hypothetical protein
MSRANAALNTHASRLQDVMHALVVGLRAVVHADEASRQLAAAGRSPESPKRGAAGPRFLQHRAVYLAFDLFTVAGFLSVNIVLLRIIHGSFNAEFAYSALIALTGLVLGAVAALIITPYSVEERTQWCMKRHESC